jgi:hypothetical protein
MREVWLPLSVHSRSRLGVGPAIPWDSSAGRGRSPTVEIEAPVPSSRATTERPTRMVIGVVLFAVGVLARVGIAAWMMPPA